MKKGKRALSLVLGLVLACALAAPARAEEVKITWLPEGVTPVNTSYWNVEGSISSPRDVKKGDLIAVERDGKYGYVDLSGELVIPFTQTRFQAQYCFFFSDGLLPVPQYDSDKNLTGTNYVDRTGKTVLELGDKTWGFAFSDGVALVAKPDSWGETKWGAIDTKGNTVVPYEYSAVLGDTLGFVGGFARFDKKNDEGKVEPFFVSADGKTVISLSEYDDVRHFSEGLAAAKKDGKWGYIDTAGNLKIPCEYDSYSDFQNGMLMLCKDGKYGYANQKGEIVIPLEYIDAQSFNQNGLARVRREGEDFYISIDKNGKKVDDDIISQSTREKLAAEGYEFSAVRRNDGLIRLTKDNKYGFADEHGEIVIPVEYDTLQESSGLFLAAKDGKYGYINKKGEVVVPLEFEWSSDYNYNYMYFLLGQTGGVGMIMKGYIGVVNQNGRYGIFENPYYEEPKPAGLFSSGSSGSSASGSVSPLLPVAGVLAAAVAGGLVLLKKKKRPQA